MSIKMTISCEQHALPEAGKWNAALQEAGFDVCLDAVNWSVGSRYRHASLLGHATGYRLASRLRDDRFRVTFHPAAGLEFTAALASIVALLAITNGTYGDDDRMRYTIDQLFAEACRSYWSDRVLLARLGEDLKVLPIDHPPLAKGETEEFRQFVVNSLVESHQLKADSVNGRTGFRLHKIYRDRLLAEINQAN